MKKTAKIMTIISYSFSCILWLLGILTLVFNALGFFAFWHIVGFGFLFYIPVPVIPVIFSTIFSLISNQKQLIIMNLISVAVSVGSILFTLFVSSSWFW